MKKTDPAPRASEAPLPNPWEPETTTAVAAPEPKKPVKPLPGVAEPTAVEFDMEGLMTDFPTARELERFVFDQTGIVLNLKGRANKLKYQVAMDVLNGVEVDSAFLGGDNPYIDKSDLIPVEEMKATPPRDATLPSEDQLQNMFMTRLMPHPDPDFRALDKKVDCQFKKYRNGMISYEVLGPIDQRPQGEKMDKFGRMRPEIIRWVDPRTGEQVIVRRDGTITPQGRNLKAIMQRMRINNSNFWEAWIDRDFVALEGGELRDPWNLHGAEE